MTLTLAGGALVVAVSLACATASYLLVERWFLHRFRHSAPMPVLGGASAGRRARRRPCLAGAFVVHARADLWRDLPPDVRRIAAAYVDYRSWPDHQAQFIEGTCFVSLGEVFDRSVSGDEPDETQHAGVRRQPRRAILAGAGFALSRMERDAGDGRGLPADAWRLHRSALQRFHALRARRFSDAQPHRRHRARRASSPAKPGGSEATIRMLQGRAGST